MKIMLKPWHRSALKMLKSPTRQLLLQKGLLAALHLAAGCSNVLKRRAVVTDVTALHARNVFSAYACVVLCTIAIKITGKLGLQQTLRHLKQDITQCHRNGPVPLWPACIKLVSASISAAAMTGANGVNGYAGRLAQVFPEAKMSLSQADPELAAIVEDEKKRQWCVEQRD
jgi:hypothetical protein